MAGEQLVVITIGETGIVKHVVPGDYQNVNSFDLDTAETWLYIGSADFDAQAASDRSDSQALPEPSHR